jgi:glycolate oxidase FAD binding subunit
VDLISGATLDGAVVGEVVRPLTLEDAAALLADAGERRRNVYIVGGATHLESGRPVERIDIALVTGGLGGVVRYEPDDLTISVQSGMAAAQLAAVLAEHGQRLPIDAEAPEHATIGGMVAAGVAGPRRYGLRTLREALIGAKIALADGTVVRTGGMVVKNVSGYDLTRLMHGSLGSLGLIAEVNFKTSPIPETLAAVHFSLADGAAAARAAHALYTSRLPFIALHAASDGSLVVGCEGHRSDVTRLRAEAERVVAACKGTVVEAALGAEDVARCWSGRMAPAYGERTTTFRIASTPSQIAAAAATARDAALRADLETVWSADAGCGLLDMSVDAADRPEDLVRLERSLLDGFDAVRVARCPARLRSRLSVFGRDPQGLALMRALKQQFDPEHRLQRGRNVGVI